SAARVRYSLLSSSRRTIRERVDGGFFGERDGRLAAMDVSFLTLLYSGSQYSQALARRRFAPRMTPRPSWAVQASWQAVLQPPADESSVTHQTERAPSPDLCWKGLSNR